MWFSPRFVQLLLLVCTASQVLAASSWGFGDATVSVQGKGSGVGGGSKEKLAPGKPLSKPITLGPSDTLKVVLTTQEASQPKKPHQAFLLLKDPTTGLDISYPFSVKDNGKAKVDLTHKDLPSQFLKSKTAEAEILIASFGTSQGYKSKAFTLNVDLDPNVPIAIPERPLRYGKLPEIHHIFKPDPKSPPVIVTLFFTASVLATLPVLFGTWLYLGGNVNHLSKALSSAPVSHALFYGSIVSLEGIFFLYYTSWNLFQTLPATLAIGTVAFLSGSRALTEVQERRLTGLR